MDYIIREYVLEDMPQLLELGEKLHKEGEYSWLSYSREKCMQLGIIVNEDKERSRVNGFVAEHDKKIIAMLVTSISEYWFNRELVAHDVFFYVDPKYRNRWPMLPVRLFRTCEAWLKKHEVVQHMIPESSRIPGISEKLHKLYNFLNYQKVGSVYEKTLNYKEKK